MKPDRNIMGKEFIIRPYVQRVIGLRERNSVMIAGNIESDMSAC
jgi:hypothetical protein